MSLGTKADGDLPESQYQKGVKQLCESGITNVPRKYILPVAERPNTINGKLNVTELHLKLPIIDFAELQGPNRSKVLSSLAYASENYGFFQGGNGKTVLSHKLVNHGISTEVISSMMDVAQRFFELPFAEREKLMTPDMATPVRYGTSSNQANDDVFYWRDFLKLVCHPVPDVLSHWPSSPMDFRNLAVAYSKETKNLFLMLVEAILESLGLINTEKKTEEDDEILKEFENGSQLMVINCYPPCPQPDLSLGNPPHSDYGFLTLLLQDEVEDLQIHHQAKWVAIEPIPGAFVVNVGDHLEIFSNGKYKSVLHRVLVNSTMQRISVASLHSLPFQSVVRPSPKLINETNPRRYKDTDFAAFLEYVKFHESKKKNFLESRKLT